MRKLRTDDPNIKIIQGERVYQALYVHDFWFQNNPMIVQLFPLFRWENRIPQVIECDTISIASMDVNPALAAKPTLYPSHLAGQGDTEADNCWVAKQQTLSTYLEIFSQTHTEAQDNSIPN